MGTVLFPHHVAGSGVADTVAQVLVVFEFLTLFRYETKWHVVR